MKRYIAPKESEKTAIPELVAKALVGRGRAFDRLNRSDEALAAYDEVEHRFGDRKWNPFVEHLIRDSTRQQGVHT